MRNRSLVIIFIFSATLNASLFDFYYLSKFNEYYKNKKYSKALDYISKIDKDSAEINYNKANTLYKLKKYNEAIEYYKRARGKGVNEIDRIFNIGNCYFKLKEYDNAIKSYKLILSVRYDDDTNTNLLLAYLKKMEKAKKKESNKKEKEKKKASKKNKSSKKSKKLTKKELNMLKEAKKREKLKRELKSMLKKNFKDKKVPIIMYKIDGIKSTTDSELNPW